MAIFWVTKSIVQLPFSRLVDKYDDLYDIRWLLIGTVLVIMAPVIYLFAPSIGYIYFAQFINGVGSGLAYPAWLGLWSTHLDKHKESFEWSFYSTCSGLIGAVAAIVGSHVAQQFGFTYTLIGVIVLASFGVIAILYLYYFHKHVQQTKRKKRRKRKRIAH